MKLPLSVLVVVHTAEMDVLLLERAARPGFWQSVTGSLDRPDEPHDAAAARELHEETGIQAERARLTAWNVAYTFEIYPQWRHRFAPGVTHNTERLFSLELPERRMPPTRLPAIRLGAGEATLDLALGVVDALDAELSARARAVYPRA